MTPSPTLTLTYTVTFTPTASATLTDSSTPSATPTISSTFTPLPTQTPKVPTLNGPIFQNGGFAIFSGSGAPGDTVYISVNGSYTGLSGTVAADGTFVVSGPLGVPINPSDNVSASAGSQTGPSAPPVVAVAAPAGPAATTMTAEAAGATFITANGIPGTVITAVDPATHEVLGSATVGANGEVAIALSHPLTPGETVQLVSGGILQTTLSAGPTAGQPPLVTLGSVIEEGSAVQGTGVPGATVQAVDSSGLVLGSTVVDAKGNFYLPITGAVAGHSVDIIQNGVKAGTGFTAFKMGSEKAYTSANIFNPTQGAKLNLSFKADNDDHVTVHIFNVAGTLVMPLLEMDVRAGVLYAASWDGRNADGSTVAAGVYIISVHGRSIHTLKKVVVMK